MTDSAGPGPGARREARPSYRAIVRAVPKEPDDTREVERFAAALDDPALPGTSFDWEGRNRIRIRTTVAPGQALDVLK